MANIAIVKSIPSVPRYIAILDDGTEVEIDRCTYYRVLIGLIVPLAEVGEYAGGGKPESEARRNAEVLAEARRVAV